MANTKSPPYPYIDLREAVQRVEMLYGKEKTYSAPKEIVAESLGYSSLNGASLRMIGALTRYDLISYEGDDIKVSDNALKIVKNPVGHPERFEALRNSFNTPKIFVELSERYGGSLPSDRNIQSYLTLAGFSENAAKKVVKYYRESAAYLDEEKALSEDLQRQANVIEDEAEDNQSMPSEGLTTSFQNSEIDDSREPENLPEEPKPPQNTKPLHLNEGEGWGKLLHLQISEGVEFQGAFKGPVTKKAVETLVSYLEIFMNTVPEAAAGTRQESLFGGDHDN